MHDELLTDTVRAGMHQLVLSFTNFSVINLVGTGISKFVYTLYSPTLKVCTLISVVELAPA